MKMAQQELDEARRLERVFIFHRWLYVPAVLLTAWLYGWLSQPLVMLASGGLAAANMAAHLINGRLGTLRAQAALGACLFAVDSLAAWALIILGMSNGQGAVYVVFALIIVEAATRYSLWGSLATDIVFALGLYLLWFAGPRNPGENFTAANYLVAVGVLSFVSLMVGMVAREWRKQRRFAEQLAADKASLLERRRISNELHDSVLKSLQGLALEAHALERDSASGAARSAGERAGYIEDVCAQLSQEIRGVILGLRDEGAGEDLVRRITGLLKAWSEKTGIAAGFTHGGDVPPLPPRMAHDLLRVIEEGLANIARHAGASRAEVFLEVSENHLRLMIRDDGCGFAADAGEIYAFVRQGKLGLVSMKERVELAGGRFTIESGPGGTVLTAGIPLAGGGPAETDK